MIDTNVIEVAQSRMKDKPLQYLCTVYSSNLAGLEGANLQAAKIAGELLQKGHRIFCPITHSHIIAKVSKLPTEFAWWMRLDEGFIDACDELLVAMIPHWDTSKGITHEINYARETGKPIKYLNIETMEITNE